MEEKSSKFDKTVEKIFNFIATVLYKLQAVILFAFGCYVGKRSIFHNSAVDLIVLIVGGLVMIMFIKVFYIGTRMPSTKRFTYTDEMGNRCIRSEDLPQIIDYLYEQEELHGNR